MLTNMAAENSISPAIYDVSSQYESLNFSGQSYEIRYDHNLQL